MATTITQEEIRDIQGRLKNAWQRVLFRLWTAKITNDPYYLIPGVPVSIIRGGWLPMWAFRGSLIGGDSGDRRLRNIRDHNIPFKQSIINGQTKDYKIHTFYYSGNKYDHPIYCLDCDLTPEDWDEIIEKNAKYYYHKKIVNVVRKTEVNITVGKDNQLCIA